MEAALRMPEQHPDKVQTYPEDDEFYYGHRPVFEYDENGRELYYYIPLTPDDFLDPEEGDFFMQGTLHEDTVDDLKSIFRYHFRNRKDIKIYSDLKIIWDAGGKENPAPDVSIFQNVRNPEKHRRVFSVAEEGVSPFFILEVVSPRYRQEDVLRKPSIYRRAGVEEYIIVDSGQKRNDSSEVSWTVQGYRLKGKKYDPIAPDRQRRIYSRTADLWIGPSESGDRIIIYDGQTGKEIPPDHEMARQEKMRAEQEKIRADQEKMRAEREKIRADSAEQELRALREKLMALGISAE